MSDIFITRLISDRGARAAAARRAEAAKAPLQQVQFLQLRVMILDRVKARYLEDRRKRGITNAEASRLSSNDYVTPEERSLMLRATTKINEILAGTRKGRPYEPWPMSERRDPDDKLPPIEIEALWAGVYEAIGEDQKHYRSKAEATKTQMLRASQWGEIWDARCRHVGATDHPSNSERSYRTNRFERYNVCQEILRVLGTAQVLVSQCMERGESPTLYTQDPKRWQGILGKEMYALYYSLRERLKTLDESRGKNRLASLDGYQEGALAIKRMAAREAARRYRAKEKLRAQAANAKAMRTMEERQDRETPIIAAPAPKPGKELAAAMAHARLAFSDEGAAMADEVYRAMMPEKVMDEVINTPSHELYPLEDLAPPRVDGRTDEEKEIDAFNEAQMAAYEPAPHKLVSPSPSEGAFDWSDVRAEPEKGDE